MKNLIAIILCVLFTTVVSTATLAGSVYEEAVSVEATVPTSAMAEDPEDLYCKVEVGEVSSTCMFCDCGELMADAIEANDEAEDEEEE